MKLRNKLAAVLATAMVMTSVPVVTMAASTNSITTGTLTISEDAVFTNSATAPALNIEFKNFKANEVFYVTLENAEWNGARGSALPDENPTYSGYWMDNTTDVEATIVDKETLKVEIKDAAALDSNKQINIPLLMKEVDGQVKVKLEAKGSGSTITEGTWVVANTTDAVGTAKVTSAKSFNKDGKIGTIILTEAYKGSFKRTDSKKYYALIELNDSDFKFDTTKLTAAGTATLTVDNDGVGSVAAGTKHNVYKTTAKKAYGFGSGDVELNVYIPENDDATMYVELPGEASDSQGQYKLENLYVKSKVKNPTTGELTVDVSGAIEEANGLVVATVGDYTASITVKDDKAVAIVGGQKEEVEFTFKEAVDGTLSNSREIDFVLENGYLAEAVLDKDGEFDEDATLEAIQKGDLVIIKSLKHKAGSDTVKSYKTTEVQANVTDIVVEEGKVVGFTLKPLAQYEGGKLDSFVFTADIRGGLNQKGDVTVTATSRDLDEKVSAVIATVSAPVTVTTEAAVLKTGLKDQLAGKVTVAEAEKNTLKKGEKLTFFLEDAQGITVSTNSSEKPEVKVTAGDLQVGDVKVTTAVNKDGETVPAVTVEIKRASKEASTIEISNFHFDVDRTAAQGSYKLQVAGKALSDFTVNYYNTKTSKFDIAAPADVIEVKDFIVNGTPNTQDITASNGLAKGTIKFEIGKTTYTAIDGTEKTMDATAYIQDPGYTMIPVRYVAEAFGVDSKDILFSNGTVTIFAGTRTIQLTNGSKVALVNGAQVTMGAAVTIKDNRTYAPIGEIATILGLSKNWDASTKVATFVNA